MSGLYGECETCAQSDKRYCIGCQLMRRTDGSFSRTGWTPKPMTITFTSVVHANEKDGDCDEGTAEAVRGINSYV